MGKLFVLFNLLNIVDGIITQFGINIYGISYEKNFIYLFLFGYLGVGLSLIVMKTMATVCGFYLYRLRQKEFLLFLIGVLVLINFAHASYFLNATFSAKGLL